MGWWENRCQGTDIWESHRQEHNRYLGAPRMIRDDQDAMNRYYLLGLSSRYEWMPRMSWMTRKKEND